MAIQSEEDTFTGTHKCVFSGYEVIMRSRKKESNFKWRGETASKSHFLSSPENLRRDYHPVFLWFGCKILKLTTSQVLLQCMNQPETMFCSRAEQMSKVYGCHPDGNHRSAAGSLAGSFVSVHFFICRQPDMSLLSGCVLTRLQIDTSD